MPVRSGPILGKTVLGLFGTGLLVLLTAHRFNSVAGRPEGTKPAEGRLTLLVTIDSLRADALSVYGDSTRATPHLDAFAKRAIVFEQAMSPASWTVPAVGALMTGLDPLALRIEQSLTLARTVPTWAERMHQSGYRTVAIVANPYLTLESGFSRGFDEFQVAQTMLDPEWRTSVGAPPLARTGRPPGPRTDAANDVTDAAIQQLRSHRDRPLFLWVHYFDPHTPYAPPPGFQPRGAPPAPLGMEFTGDPALDAPTPAHLAWIRRLYQGEVRFVDQQVGRLFSEIRRLGLFDAAAIAVTADHGEEFHEHGRAQHGMALYREALHVPLILKTPAPSLSGRARPPVSTRRLMATMLDISRVSYDASSLTPPSLMRIFSDARQAPPVFSATQIAEANDQVGVIFSNLHYIRWAATGREELYALDRDPGERDSIAATATDQLVLARRLIDEREVAAARTRARYGITPTRRVVNAETAKRLRALGYVY